MKHTIAVEKEISGKPNEIWETVSAGGNVHIWFPLIQSCRLEGNGEGAARFCVMADGNELTERIVEIDHDERLFRYAVEQHPLPAQNLISSIGVKNLGSDRTSIFWGAEFEADGEAVAQTKEMLKSIYLQGIQSLEDHHRKYS